MPEPRVLTQDEWGSHRWHYNPGEYDPPITSPTGNEQLAVDILNGDAVLPAHGEALDRVQEARALIAGLYDAAQNPERTVNAAYLARMNAFLARTAPGEAA